MLICRTHLIVVVDSSGKEFFGTYLIPGDIIPLFKSSVFLHIFDRVPHTLTDIADCDGISRKPVQYSILNQGWYSDYSNHLKAQFSPDHNPVKNHRDHLDRNIFRKIAATVYSIFLCILQFV